MAIAALFVLCGLIRLAYYNVTEELRQDSTDKNRSMYKGVPITVSSILVPVLMCFYPGSTGTFHYLYTALLALMGICYIAPLNVKKPGKLGAVIMIAIGAAVFLVMIFCK